MATSRLKVVPSSTAPGVARPAAEPSRPAPAPRGRRVGWALLGLAALTAGLAGGWWLLKPVQVSLRQASVGEAVDAVYASGVVEYVRQARVAPVVTAPIVRVLADEGQDVRAGQPLAQLNDGPQVATALQFEAQAAQARAAFDRTHRLFEAGFAAKASDDDAAAQRDAAAAAATNARSLLENYRLVAPFAGRVLRREAELGDLATAGQPLFVIADLRKLRVTADVDERDVGRLRTGQVALVHADGFPGQVFRARISEITPQGDATGRVFRVRLALPTSTPLKPGMTVETNLVTGRRDRAVLVPTAALSKGAVWTVVEGRARRLSVRTGAAGADLSEIVAGVRPGQPVIVAPPANLKDGARVTARASR